METRDFLINHYRKYPKLQIQDIFKFIHQSVCGCEHFVSTAEDATERIKKEYFTVSKEASPLIEQLDGAFSRVHLSCMNSGITPETFGKLFYLSAIRDDYCIKSIERKIEVAKQLIHEGEISLSESEFSVAAEKWKRECFPAVHHSDIFREEYKPSYRVINNRYAKYIELFAEIDKRLAKGKLTVAIEGGSASGKTTLGEILENVYGCTVFHMDDFFLQPHQRTPERYAQVGGNIDHERFLEEVLKPLSEGKTVNYRRFDCHTMKISDGVEIKPEKLTVVEGTYSLHPNLAPYYDFSVLLEISPELQRERILIRNTPEMARRFFEEWIPLERAHLSSKATECAILRT